MERFRKGIVFAAAALALAAIFSSALLTTSEVEGSIAGTELQQRLVASGDRPLVLDVRTPVEYAAGHVPGAVNVPHDQVAARLGEFAGAKDREVVVYCQRGGRASAAIAELAREGFAKLRHLSGDMAGWSADGRPVTTGDAP